MFVDGYIEWVMNDKFSCCCSSVILVDLWVCVLAMFSRHFDKLEFISGWWDEELMWWCYFRYFWGQKCLWKQQFGVNLFEFHEQHYKCVNGRNWLTSMHYRVYCAWAIKGKSVWSISVCYRGLQLAKTIQINKQIVI